jgi:uncharacterized protein
MKITGSHTIGAPREQVWQALHDPARLARTLPGCQQLEVLGDGEYAATVWAGVASIKGSYKGTVRLSDADEPTAFTLHAAGRGGPGTIDAQARITLAETNGQTEVRYEADAVIGGPVAGVGQRVLVSTARRQAAEFFDNIERDLRGELAAPSEPAAAPAQAGQVFAGSATPPAIDLKTLVAAAVVGALIALLGVWLGRRLR